MNAKLREFLHGSLAFVAFIFLRDTRYKGQPLSPGARGVFIAWMSLPCIALLATTGRALKIQAAQRALSYHDFIFVAAVVGAMFFIKGAVERCLIPPHITGKEQRSAFIQTAESRSRKLFIKAMFGLSHLFLVLYAIYFLAMPLRPRPMFIPIGPEPVLAPPELTNWIIPSLLFLALGLLARARAIILHLAQGASSNQQTVRPRLESQST